MTWVLLSISASWAICQKAKELHVGNLVTAFGEAPSSSSSPSFGELHQVMSKAIRGVFSLIAPIKRNIDTHGKSPECGESHEPLGSVLVLIVQAAPAVLATSRKLD